MYGLYQSNHLTGIEIAVLIVVSWQDQDGDRSAEHHILLPYAHPCEVMSQRNSVLIPEQQVSKEELHNYVLETAKNCLQNRVDEQWLKTGIGLAPVVQLNNADDAALRALRFAGVCQCELSTIASQTYCNELKVAIRKLSQLPIISTTTTA